EGTPSLAPLPGIDLDAYKDSLIERFSNPEIRDTLARLGAESSDRIPKWLLPVVIDNLASGHPVEVAAAICASWARYAEGHDETGGRFTIVDRYAEQLQTVAATQAEDDLAFVRQAQFFGHLADQPDRIPKWLRPVVIDNLASGHPVEVAAAICASWARYAEGHDETGGRFTIVDRYAEQLQTVAATQAEDDLAFVRQEQFFGHLADQPRFTEPYRAALASLHERGAKETARRLAAPEPL